MGANEPGSPAVVLGPENPDRCRHADAVTSDPHSTATAPAHKCPRQRPTAQQPSFEATDTCDGEPESDSVAVCSSPRSRPAGFSFNFLTLPSVNQVPLCGLDCASVTPGRALCPRGLHQSFPPDTFIHRIGITEEARMDGSAAPGVCLIYLASVYFLTFF